MLTPGTTHVAVGFVDLGDLASACTLFKGADLKTKPLRYCISNRNLVTICYCPGTTGTHPSMHLLGGLLPISASLNSGLLLLVPCTCAALHCSWLGYEVSAYSVAKTLIVHQMLMDGAPAETVLQVRLYCIFL